MVMIRPEALRLSPLKGSSSATVPNIARSWLPGCSAGQLGCTCLSRTGRTVAVRSSMPGQFLPNEESHVAITLNTRQALVFPAKEPT